MTDNGAVRWFCELGVGDAPVAGGKGANLGELTNAGLPVPPGFVLTAEAYLRALALSGRREYLARSVVHAPVDDPVALAQLATSLTREIRGIELPADTVAGILQAYRRLGPVPVAVRSSATSEDAAGTSFAGMNETFTNVYSEQELLTCIADCWASTYGARMIAYRASHGITDEPAIAVVVQSMVDSDRSGVIFSADPLAETPGRVVVEGAFGLGEVVVGGQLIPDTYFLDRRGPRLVEIRIGYKTHKIVRSSEGGDLHVALSVREATRRVLSDTEAIDLAKLGLRVEQHYGRAQDLEWAIQSGQIYLVQSRPITTRRPESPSEPTAARASSVRGQLLVGVGVGVGRATGPVRTLSSPDHAAQFRDGEILVSTVTSPDWMPILRRASALVTDGGGVTCHAAILSRELGIPSVVGARTATRLLHDGQPVTVDGLTGTIAEG
jgi:pyruvate,water dikinase